MRFLIAGNTSKAVVIATAGFLVPGGNAMTAAFMTPRTCGIHDHNDPGNAAWMSRIVVR
jgi:hypothetical protein